ncbi:MAG: putative sulfoacetate transporter SauU [Nitrospira sp.]|nr:putative sulfoacetate transporter SauU [Nitrospira sp.]
MAAAEPERLEEPAIDDNERKLMLWLSNISHLANHFQGQMPNALYPVIMKDLGFGYVQLGILVALRNGFTSWLQLGYGFVTPFINHCRLLGITNLLLAVGTAVTGFTGSFFSFTLARCFAAAGSSAQHPVGASILATYFPNNRGTVLAMNSTIASVGNLIAPAVCGILITFIGWREIFWMVAIVSALMGVGYFFFQNRVHREIETGPKRARIAQSMASYWRVAHDRNFLLIGLVFMVGAAGRGGEDIQAYFSTHWVNDLGMELAYAGFALSLLQVGSLFGPMFFGWLSDRVNRKAVTQVSLVLSALSTFWLARQGAANAALIFNLLFQGAVTSSRGTLTQAIIADNASAQDQDAAFSIYFFLGFFSTPIWALVTGFMMEAYEFETTFSILSLSYFAAVLLMFFVSDPKGTRKVRPTTAS